MVTMMMMMVVMVRVDRYVDGESRSSHIMETGSLTRIAIHGRYKYDHQKHNREFLDALASLRSILFSE